MISFRKLLVSNRSISRESSWFRSIPHPALISFINATQYIQEFCMSFLLMAHNFINEHKQDLLLASIKGSQAKACFRGLQTFLMNSELEWKERVHQTGPNTPPAQKTLPSSPEVSPAVPLGITFPSHPMHATGGIMQGSWHDFQRSLGGFLAAKILTAHPVVVQSEPPNDIHLALFLPKLISECSAHSRPPNTSII